MSERLIILVQYIYHQKIMEMKSSNTVKKYIDSLQSPKRKILIADTNLRILQGRMANADLKGDRQKVPYA